MQIKIIKQLSNLHPRFYPIPGRQELEPITGRPVLKVVQFEGDFLTKDELLELYGECGNYLHRGSIRQLLTKWEPTPNFDKIAIYLDKLINLLGHHQIQLSQSDKQFMGDNAGPRGRESSLLYYGAYWKGQIGYSEN